MQSTAIWSTVNKQSLRTATPKRCTGQWPLQHQLREQVRSQRRPRHLQCQWTPRGTMRRPSSPRSLLKGRVGQWPVRPYDCRDRQVGCRPHFGKLFIGTTHHKTLLYNSGCGKSSGCSRKMSLWFQNGHYNLRRRGKAAPFVLLVYLSALHPLRYNLSADMARRLMLWTQKEGTNQACSGKMPTPPHVGIQR